MIIAGMACLGGASLLLAVGLCFVKNSKTLIFLLQTFFLISLLCFGIVCANFQNNFSGFSVLLFLSIAPQFLNLFDFKSFLDAKRESLEKIANEEIDRSAEVAKKKLSNKLLFSNGSLLKSLAFFMSAICIAFCGLYLGIETYFGFLIGLAIALFATFILLAAKKKINIFDLLSYFLAFLSVGIVLGQILTVLLYSFALPNILFSVGSLMFCVFVLLSTFLKSKFDHLAYLSAMILLFFAILF